MSWFDFVRTMEPTVPILRKAQWGFNDHKQSSPVCCRLDKNQPFQHPCPEDLLWPFRCLVGINPPVQENYKGLETPHKGYLYDSSWSISLSSFTEPFLGYDLPHILLHRTRQTSHTAAAWRSKNTVAQRCSHYYSGCSSMRKEPVAQPQTKLLCCETSVDCSWVATTHAETQLGLSLHWMYGRQELNEDHQLSGSHQSRCCM